MAAGGRDRVTHRIVGVGDLAQPRCRPGEPLLPDRALDQHRPDRRIFTLLGVAALGEPDLLVEVEATAVLD
ncbi:hypothetical protein [Nocardia rhizosphaerae]|uniref:Uncharacterized protein n=1 Tax=Nocardia rhizosphaerae TaxID=1691571 RepID=A0ABV8L7P1_9NOCA